MSIDIKQYIEDQVRPFLAKTEAELLEFFHLPRKSKNKFDLISRKIFGSTQSVNTLPQFKAEKLRFNHLRIESNGKIKESLSLPPFDFTRIAEEKWQDSDFYKLLNDYVFVFFVYLKHDGQYYFDRVKFWECPSDVLQNAKLVWEKTQHLIRTGKIIKSQDRGQNDTFFPKAKENKYFHVRPHARNKADTNKLPVQDKMTGFDHFTKQCFWIDKRLLEQIIFL